MFAALSNDALGNFQIKRVTTLYDSTLSSLFSIIVGVVLVFLFLSPSANANAPLLKLWVVFMLSTLALRGCLWLMFRAGKVDGQNARYWELGFAFAMCLSGIGWGTLSGSLYPSGNTLRVFILVLTIITYFFASPFVIFTTQSKWKPCWQNRKPSSKPSLPGLPSFAMAGRSNAIPVWVKFLTAA